MPRRGAKTLFATHYHELTVLEESIDVLKNYCVSVKEVGEDIIFLHKIVPGSVDHSYGIQVARLAGVPTPVLSRAKELLQLLDSKEKQVVITKEVQVDSKKEPCSQKMAPQQLDLFTHAASDEIIGTIKALDVMRTTPFEALELLYALQKKVQ